MNKNNCKNSLVCDCLKIYNIGTLSNLKKNIEKICKKYFPNCSNVFINSCYQYFYSLRELTYSKQDFDRQFLKHI